MEKNAAAGILQNRCRVLNGKKELNRRKAKKKQVEGLIAVNLAKLLNNSKGKYLMVWKQFIIMRHQEKASYKVQVRKCEDEAQRGAKRRARRQIYATRCLAPRGLRRFHRFSFLTRFRQSSCDSLHSSQEFGRILLSKRKMRLERLIAKALGKSTLLMARQCLRAWMRWTLDLKLCNCASAIQRRWRGMAGRRNFLKERAKKAKQEEVRSNTTTRSQFVGASSFTPTPQAAFIAT